MNKIRRMWMRMRLQPIRVYCLHHVCAEFDAESMNRGDWMEKGEFKKKVMKMQKKGVEFISMHEAYRHICGDWIRCEKYAVLTFDDGYASLKEILPWLEEQKIPCTLFINGKYLDEKSYRKSPKEKYLTKEEIWALSSTLIEIGNHGWEHVRVSDMTEEEFRSSVVQNVDLLSKHPNYIPFWAYTYGTHTNKTDKILIYKGLIPVYIEGLENYSDKNQIHRELL